jgi:hypothetical protein
MDKDSPVEVLVDLGLRADSAQEILNALQRAIGQPTVAGLFRRVRVFSQNEYIRGHNDGQAAQAEVDKKAIGEMTARARSSMKEQADAYGSEIARLKSLLAKSSVPEIYDYVVHIKGDGVAEGLTREEAEDVARRVRENGGVAVVKRERVGR